MILQLQQKEDLLPFAQTPYGCRLAATAEAYGMEEPFALFWGQEDKAAFCKLDDVLICETLPGADFLELKEFVNSVGARVLVCSAVTAGGLRMPVARHGPILRLEAACETPGVAIEENPPLREVHALLESCRSDSFAPPDFEAFYMDLSHRIRHDTALALGIRKEGVLCAAAVCVAKSKYGAMISSVAASPASRREGLGSAVVCALAERLAPREVYLYRTAEENAAFYRHLGFVRYGEWAEIDI